MKFVSIAALAGLALSTSAFGQFAITPNGNGSGSTTNGFFQITGVPSTPSSTSWGGNVTYSATTNAVANDNAFAYQWLWRVNTSAGSTQDARDFFMSNGSGGGTNSFLTTTGNSLGTLNSATHTFDIFNVNNGYSFLAASNYVISNDGTGVQVLNRMTITNRDTGPLSLTLFNVLDYDLVASAGGDTVSWNGTDAFNWVDGSRTAQHRALGFSAFQASDFSFSGTTALNRQFTDAARTTLNNTVIAGAGDRLSAFQFDLTLAPGESISVFVGSSINTVAPIPTPGAMALVGLAGLAGLRRRRA
jgi:MYXO-CTERM domain-containing protein